MPAPYDALKIANWFIARAQRDDKVLTVMMILKLCYIAQGWHLESREKPLFWNRIEAWRFGPVIRDVYLTFRSQGLEVADPALVAGEEIDSDAGGFLEEVYQIYGDLPAFWFTKLTHISGGPWDIAIKASGYFSQIPNLLLNRHYEMKRADAERETDHVN